MHYHVEVHGQRNWQLTTDDRAEAEYGACCWRRRGALRVKGAVVVVGCEASECPEYAELMDQRALRQH